jgi:hypothetical protein
MASYSNSTASVSDIRSNVHRTALLRVCIEEAINLGYYSEKTHELQPYIRVSAGKHAYHTESSTTTEAISWNNIFEIPVDELDTLTVKLMDHDDFDKDMMLAGITFEPETYKKWEESDEDLWIKVWEPSISTNPKEESMGKVPILNFTPSLTISDPSSTRVPLIHLKIRYINKESNDQLSAVFTSYFTVYGNSDKHTEYNVNIYRGDGYEWIIRVRYRQLYDLRKELIKEFPELIAVPFPKKTYLGWLSPRRSKFNEGRLEKRRQKLEGFMNHLLKFKYHKKNREVGNLLTMTT